MNLKLNQDNFPTIYITPSEKNTFISLFRSAIDGFRDSSSNGQVIRAYTSPDYLQQGFYDFLGNKILDNLKMAEDQLKNLGRYHIIFNSIQSPGSMYTAKQKVSSWFNSRKQIFQMNLKPRERTLEIIGNIPYEVVNDILGTLKKTKYTLSTTD